MHRASITARMLQVPEEGAEDEAEEEPGVEGAARAAAEGAGYEAEEVRAWPSRSREALVWARW